jgi:hypothetical protein
MDPITCCDVGWLSHRRGGAQRSRRPHPASATTLPAQFQAPDHARFLDNPYLVMTGGGFGPIASAAVAGAISSRATRRRQPWLPETRGQTTSEDTEVLQAEPGPLQNAEAERR